MDNIYNNKEAFKKIAPLNITIIILFMLTLIGLILVIKFKTKIYDNYQAKGYITCTTSCTLTVLYPSTITYDLLTINNKNLVAKKESEEIVIDEVNLISYKKLILSIPNNIFTDQEIVNVNFYYNKQRIINKLLKLIF